MNLSISILKVLAYFDLFDYPLMQDEILFFLDQQVFKADLIQALESLLVEGYVFKHHNLYSVRDEAKLSARRIKGTQHAQQLLPVAKKISRFLYYFPYVRGIAISGSLSKNFAEENADLDYFIITKSNRLWIARTCMHLFKKLSFLVGKQHQLCMNYYVDEEGLEIPEKNVFTAIELFTLLPVMGNGVMDNFFKTNDWAGAYYPNYSSKTLHPKTDSGNSGIKNVFEKLLNNRAGDWLDNYFMKMTTRRWKKKEDAHKRSVYGKRMGLCTGKHFSKPNPVFFQEMILSRYTERLNQVTSQWNLVTE